MEKINFKQIGISSVGAVLFSVISAFSNVSKTYVAEFQNVIPNPINNSLVQPAEAKPPKSVCTSHCLKTAIRDGNIVCVKKTVSCKPTKDLY